MSAHVHSLAEAFDRKSKYRLEDFDTLQPGTLAWRVKGLWPAVGVCFVGGPSMSGKSFWVLDALAKVCRGQDVLGRKSIPAGVVYVAAEGAHGVRNRIAGLRQRVGKLGGRLKFIAQQPDLLDPDDVADLQAFLEGARDELEAAGHGLGVVVVDTLAAAAAGADENSSSDMGPVLRSLQEMAAELGCLVLVVAHTGKDETRGLRGWSGQIGNADGIVMLTEPEGETRSGLVLKVKDGPAGDRFAFTLERVTIGIDDDGDEITTCVVEPCDVPDAPRSGAGRKPTKAQASSDLILRAFNRVIADQPVTVHAVGAIGVTGARVDDVRRLAYEIGVGPPDADLPSDADDTERRRLTRKWQDQRKADFTRGLQHLLAAKTLRMEGGYVWDHDAKARQE